MKKEDFNFLNQNLSGYRSGNQSLIFDRCSLTLPEIIKYTPDFQGKNNLVIKPLKILLAKNVNEKFITIFTKASKLKLINLVPAKLILCEDEYEKYPIHKLIKQYKELTHVPVYIEFNTYELKKFTK